MPAVDMLIECHRLETSGWVLLSAARTDADGRINSMLSGTQLTTGDHRVNFMTGAWYARRRMDCFFPTVTIEFRVSDAARHHHIPLLVSPFSYSTYRGS
ncbi:MAG: hydroxyisourate hydrolase [Phycisphaerales bacterium]|nr:hydroxyisourate hydrolase [Phycisphaerales bacterium]